MASFVFYQDKADDVFNASDSDTVVPSTSQDSPNRNSADGTQSVDSETPTARIVYIILITFNFERFN